MNIALVYGGQPRFTYDFVDLMSKLKGFTSATIYMVLWRSEWAQTEQEAINRIQKILPSNYSIGKISIVDEPVYQLPISSKNILPAQPENTAWWYSRIYKQFLGISMAFDLIDKRYDAIVRFRGDGSIDQPIDLSKIDFEQVPLLFAKNGGTGFKGYELNDQFAIGTHEYMEFHCSIGKHIKELIPLIDPNWKDSNTVRGDTWQWGAEHIIGYRMKQNKLPIVVGDFNTVLNTYGRSKFTDKHYHHKIAADPTE